jgi:hypothetical protein
MKESSKYVDYTVPITYNGWYSLTVGDSTTNPHGKNKIIFYRKYYKCISDLKCEEFFDSMSDC